MSMLKRLLPCAGVIAALLSATATGANGQAKPDFLPRAAWKAKPANAGMMIPHTPREIVIHMTGVRQQPKISLERKMRGLQGYSMRRARIGNRMRDAWGDVPYHFYIGVSGRIAEARDLAYAGDSNTRYNLIGRIQVVVEGSFDREEPNANQIAALTNLVRWLAAKYDVPPSKISGHNDHAATTCPGKNLKRYLPALRDAVAAKT